MRKLLLLVLCLSAVSGCVSIPNVEGCSVAGVLSAGGICAESLTGKTRDLDFAEFLSFLEAAPESPAAPEKGAAVCMSSKDFNRMKTALEEACRALGKRCSYERPE